MSVENKWLILLLLYLNKFERAVLGFILDIAMPQIPYN